MLKPRFYPLLEQSIEDGVRRGYSRIHKHNETPTEEEIVQSIINCVMGELHENFIFENQDD